jgi:fatty-acyl-CoA synthase
VRDVAVAGVDGPDGLVVKAWVVRAPGADVDASELRRHCSGRLASFKVPRLVAFVDDIPRNAMNKVVRSKLH